MSICGAISLLVGCFAAHLSGAAIAAFAISFRREAQHEEGEIPGAEGQIGWPKAAKSSDCVLDHNATQRLTESSKFGA
jgi:hypothetical protein